MEVEPDTTILLVLSTDVRRGSTAAHAEAHWESMIPSPSLLGGAFLADTRQESSSEEGNEGLLKHKQHSQLMSAACSFACLLP